MMNGSRHIRGYGGKGPKGKDKHLGARVAICHNDARLYCKAEGLNPDWVFSKLRYADYVDQRYKVIYYLREHANGGQGYSFPCIGRALGRHHSSIVYAYRKHMQNLKINIVGNKNV